MEKEVMTKEVMAGIIKSLLKDTRAENWKIDPDIAMKAFEALTEEEQRLVELRFVDFPPLSNVRAAQILHEEGFAISARDAEQMLKWERQVAEKLRNKYLDFLPK